MINRVLQCSHFCIKECWPACFSPDLMKLAAYTFINHASMFAISTPEIGRKNRIAAIRIHVLFLSRCLHSYEAITIYFFFLSAFFLSWNSSTAIYPPLSSDVKFNNITLPEGLFAEVLKYCRQLGRAGRFSVPKSGVSRRCTFGACVERPNSNRSPGLFPLARIYRQLHLPTAPAITASVNALVLCIQTALGLR
jgi:hypothetical protein